MEFGFDGTYYIVLYVSKYVHIKNGCRTRALEIKKGGDFWNTWSFLKSVFVFCYEHWILKMNILITYSNFWYIVFIYLMYKMQLIYKKKYNCFDQKIMLNHP